jgi:5,10-methylenetetrahydrofolate reductase
MSARLLDSLRHTGVLSVELRPPRAELDAAAGRDAWIDTHHAVRGFVRQGSYVFLTDNAVGSREEHTLRHLIINLGDDVPRDRVVPFLTTKHSLDYCLSYAERAWQAGFESLVVLGGDRSVGPPRCVNHAWELRRLIRQHVPDLTLGGWANPHANPEQQVGFLAEDHLTAEYFLTQVVSHHDRQAVDRFVEEADRRRVSLPGIFGVFYYRSANPRTLDTLRQFLPVPTESLSREFREGATPDEICARTLRTLRSAGVRHVYLSNLPVSRARQTLERILDLAGWPAAHASSNVRPQTP